MQRRLAERFADCVLQQRFQMREQGTSSFWSWEGIVQIWFYILTLLYQQRISCHQQVVHRNYLLLLSRLGELTWAPFLSLLLLICCRAARKGKKQNTLHCELIVKKKKNGKKSEGKAECMRNIGRGRKGRKKEQL